MKFQLILLVAFLVAIFALPQRNADNDNANETNSLVRINDNQASTEDELIDNNLTSTTDETTGRPGCSKRRCDKNGSRRHGGAWRRRNSSKVNEEQSGTTQGYEGIGEQELEQEISIPKTYSESGRKHHRHHHRRHHHHHHRNCTTTPPPSTTTTPSSPVSVEMDEVFVRRHENDGTQDE